MIVFIEAISYVLLYNVFGWKPEFFNGVLWKGKDFV
jgi:hypothetical protein